MDFETINVVYSGNDEYRDALMISLLSLVMHNQNHPIHVIYLTGDFTIKDKEYKALTGAHAYDIISYCKKYNRKLTYEVLEMNKYLDDFFIKNPNLKTTYTPYSMLRLLLDKVDHLPERLLYLDGDTLIMGDIYQLYSMDMGEYELGMVQDAVGHHYFGRKYCNSGVLLMNMKAIRENDLFTKTRRFLKHHLLFMPDQTSLNATCKKKKLILPRIYNEQKEVREDTIIRHYCKVLHWLPYPHTINIKPWHPEEFKKAFGDISSDVIEEYIRIKGDQKNKQEVYDFFNK